MLQIQHIRKEYKTGKLVQKALDDVSLNLRDNEFVAILGPSGSGKTTLLNIIRFLSTNFQRDFHEKIQRPGLGFLPKSYDRICLPEL